MDETGNTYGSLEVLHREYRGKTHAEWFCLCKCGGHTVATGNNLRRGKVQSCGCGRDAAAKRRATTHGQKHTRIYHIYSSAKGRCCNPNNQAYKDYGGRGIEFRFASFEHFISIMGVGYSETLTLDRTDNEGHYEPGNCRWATRMQQGSNKRNNTWIPFDGGLVHVSEVARRTGIPQQTISNRVKRYGKSDPRIVFVGNLKELK